MRKRKPTATQLMVKRIDDLEEELRQIVIYTRIEKAALRSIDLASIEKLIGPVPTPRC